MKTIYTEVLRDNAKRRVLEAASAVQKGDIRDAYGTCMNCKLSMRQFLAAYLIDHGIEPGEFQTIHVLMEKCISVNDEFKDLDLSAIDCRYEQLNDDYCRDAQHLQACVHTVEQIQQRVS